MTESLCIIDGCENPKACRGWCWTHYDRWRKNGDPMKLGPRGERGTIIADPIERFPSKVEKTEGCWIWIGRSTERGGYGQFAFGGRSVLAHRWSYEHHVGPIPTGLTIDHLCCETRCVNPEHLEPVTIQENSRRAGIARERSQCGRGHTMAGDNIARRKDGNRYCRECARMAQRDRRAKYAARRAAERWLTDGSGDPTRIITALLKVL